MILALLDLASAADNVVPSGKVTDAWNYVIAAYAITWGAFGLYTLSLIGRSSVLPDPSRRRRKGTPRRIAHPEEYDP